MLASYFDDVSVSDWREFEMKFVSTFSNDMKDIFEHEVIYEMGGDAIPSNS